MLYTEATKGKLDGLLAAVNGLQMVSIVSQNTDKELDELDAYAVEMLTTADTGLATTLRQRLHLLRSMREEQAEVLYAGFKSARTDQQLETFAFDMDDVSLERLERVVHNRILGETPEIGRQLTERLQKVQVMRRDLKPLRDSIFRFFAADTLEDAESVLLEEAHLLLTQPAGQEILQNNSRDRALRERIDLRKKLWRKVYGQHSGKTITGSVYMADVEAEIASASEPTIPTRSVDMTLEMNHANENNNHRLDNDEAITEADRLMEEVYDLLDQAIGNAMVAFSIYRKNKSTRADEALKLLAELHNETKDVI